MLVSMSLTRERTSWTYSPKDLAVVYFGAVDVAETYLLVMPECIYCYLSRACAFQGDNSKIFGSK